MTDPISMTAALLWGGKKAKKALTPELSSLPPAVSAPTEESTEVQEAKRQERILLRGRRGRLSTILTSSAGLGGQAPVQRKKLLGE